MKRDLPVRWLFLALILLTGISQSNSQSLQIIRYSEDQGLSGSLVKSAATDHKGMIWVGTDGGLFLFDGVEFSHYEGELPSQYIKKVFTRKNGDVIIITDLGILVNEKNAGQIHPMLLRKGALQPVDSLVYYPKSCFEDSRNRLWIGDIRRIYRLDGQKLHSYFPGEKAATDNYQRSYTFTEDGFGNLYAFSEPGPVFLYHPESDSFKEIPLPVNLRNIHAVIQIDSNTFLVATREGLAEFYVSKTGQCTGIQMIKGTPEISGFYQYSPDHFYAGTWANGLYEIRKKGRSYEIRQIPEVTEKNINSIIEGSNGTIWLASDNGLLLIQHNLFTAPYRELTTGYIQCISGNDAGETFFTDGQKVFRTSTNQGINPGGKTDILKQTSATLLQAVPAAGGMWFSDVNGQIWYEKPIGKPIRKFDLRKSGMAVFYLVCDQAGNVWACQDQNPSLIKISKSFEMKTYGPGQGLTSRPLVAKPDSRGALYVGGMADSAYLFTYDQAADQFVNISRRIEFERNTGLNINDIAADQDGTLWLGSSFGLLKYTNGAANRIDLGMMTSSAVKAVVIDKNHNIWFGNSLGLHMYKNGEVLSFDDRSGMSEKIINYRCLHSDQFNHLWAGTVEGVLVSSQLSEPVKSVMPGIFRILLNNDHEIPFRTNGTGFNDRSFAALKVGVLDYPQNNYRLEMFLEGRDSTWQQVQRSGQIILANLEPGSYTLKLRAKKAGNFITSDLLEWNFSVTRIWYLRWYMIILMSVVLVAVFWFGLHLKTLNLKLYNEKLELAIRERTRETILQKEHIEEQNIRILEKNQELQQVNIGLERAKEIAEEASEAQKKFLSVMTHELRTPLNAVIGAAHLLIHNNPRKEQLEELQVLRFSAENLLGLINNILDFQKIESGKVSLEKIDFNLKNLVEEIVAASKIRAREKHLSLGCHIDERIPEILSGDPLRLSQIINNLMGNAVKFTEKGSISIELLLRERAEAKVAVDFVIRDTGIGMSRETLDNIFEIFVQGSSETTRKYGGTGLGLVITRKLLELFNSKIEVESEPGIGTTFSFSIIFEESTQTDADLHINKVSYVFSKFDGQKILLVEDNQVNKLIATKFLKDWNLEVDTAENGKAAVDRMKNDRFDLVLMDIQMPEMDGYQATAAIRAQEDQTATSTPIIALTAEAKSEVSAMIFRSGMNDFISKPFNPVDLHMKIKNFLQ